MNEIGHPNEQPAPSDWQIVTLCDGFVIEVNCNGGGYRRVYADGRIVNE